jgi:virginiamycin B lyase
MKTLGMAACAAGLLATTAVQAAEVTLPEGKGSQLIEANCTQCHELGRVTGAGYTEQGWRNTVAMMLNVGSPLPKEQAEELIRYLATRFPQKPRPRAVVVEGDHDVSFAEWRVPTAGSRPHDPLATADGAIWHTGREA